MRNTETSPENIGLPSVCLKPFGYRVYLSRERAEGYCQLTLIRNRPGAGRHSRRVQFLLSFTQGCVKEQPATGGGYLIRHPRLRPAVEITYGEAASLLQDVCSQNVKDPPHLSESTLLQGLLAHNAAEINRRDLLTKLSLVTENPERFARLYLSAARRTDTPLLYDLSSPRRQRVLGDRSSFMTQYRQSYQEYTFIKTTLTYSEQRKSTFSFMAEAFVSNAFDEVLRITFLLTVIRDNQGACLAEDFTELQQEVIEAEHPENPFNDKVYCAVFALKNRERQVRAWLESNPEIFLTGETKRGVLYKWLVQQENPWQDFSVFEQVVCEFFVSERELIVYAYKRQNLTAVEQSVTTCFGVWGRRHYLSTGLLYQAFSGYFGAWVDSGILTKDDPDEVQVCIRDYATPWALLELASAPGAEFRLQDALGEYKHVGHWLWLRIFEGDRIKEIRRLEAQYGVKDLLMEEEVSAYFEGAPKRLVQEGKWRIYKMLKRYHQEVSAREPCFCTSSVKEVYQSIGVSLS